MPLEQRLEADLRALLVELMPLEHAPAHLRLAFHDAGTYDARTRTGGAHGTVHLLEELRRGDNTGWGQPCIELLAEARNSYPWVSWADLVAVGGAAGVQKCGGPAIAIGLGRTDVSTPAPPHRLPGGYEGAGLLRAIFERMGLSARELVVLSGAHTLGHTQRRPFTSDPWVFSNSYFVELLAQREVPLLPTDGALLQDAELRAFVALYAADEALFLADFAAAFRRMTWLGND
ncbi:MAG TPA: peroxidase family protein [Chloroflexota bacterium]|nr:peroxidase family protein [Chloroflexota bacterium]